MPYAVGREKMTHIQCLFCLKVITLVYYQSCAFLLGQLAIFLPSCLLKDAAITKFAVLINFITLISSGLNCPLIHRFDIEKWKERKKQCTTSQTINQRA
jgi:uncharacterized membrane protein